MITKNFFNKQIIIPMSTNNSEAIMSQDNIHILISTDF